MHVFPEGTRDLPDEKKQELISLQASPPENKIEEEQTETKVHKMQQSLN
jgi:hypothetical protein